MSETTATHRVVLQWNEARDVQSAWVRHTEATAYWRGVLRGATLATLFFGGLRIAEVIAS